MSSTNPHILDTELEARRRHRSTAPSPSPQDKSEVIPLDEVEMSGSDENAAESESFSIPVDFQPLPDIIAAQIPAPGTSVRFSREFLSKCLGGSSLSVYNRVKFNPAHVYHIPKYYSYDPIWTPQTPKHPGEHGAIIAVGSSSTPPPGPWTLFKKETMADVLEKQSGPIHCFIKRAVTEYEYIGQYKFDLALRKFSKHDVRTQITKKGWSAWTNGIKTSQWGKAMLVHLGIAKTEAEAQSFTLERIKGLFERPNTDGTQLCFYWQYMECQSYDRKLYDDLCKKGRELGWTTRDPSKIRNKTAADAPEENRAIEADSVTTDQAMIDVCVDRVSGGSRDDSGVEELSSLDGNKKPKTKVVIEID